MTPSTDGGGMGNLEHHIWALPRHNATIIIIIIIIIITWGTIYDPAIPAFSLLSFLASSLSSTGSVSWSTDDDIIYILVSTIIIIIIIIM